MISEQLINQKFNDIEYIEQQAFPKLSKVELIKRHYARRIKESKVAESMSTRGYDYESNDLNYGIN